MERFVKLKECFKMKYNQTKNILLKKAKVFIYIKKKLIGCGYVTKALEDTPSLHTLS